jgi:hypothetical protein
MTTTETKRWKAAGNLRKHLLPQEVHLNLMTIYAPTEREAKEEAARRLSESALVVWQINGSKVIRIKAVTIGTH